MTKEKTQGDELSAMLRNRAAHSSEHARNSSITFVLSGRRSFSCPRHGGPTKDANIAKRSRHYSHMPSLHAVL